MRRFLIVPPAMFIFSLGIIMLSFGVSQDFGEMRTIPATALGFDPAIRLPFNTSRILDSTCDSLSSASSFASSGIIVTDSYCYVTRIKDFTAVVGNLSTYLRISKYELQTEAPAEYTFVLGSSVETDGLRQYWGKGAEGETVSVLYVFVPDVGVFTYVELLEENNSAQKNNRLSEKSSESSDPNFIVAEVMAFDTSIRFSGTTLMFTNDVCEPILVELGFSSRDSLEEALGGPIDLYCYVSLTTDSSRFILDLTSQFSLQQYSLDTQEGSAYSDSGTYQLWTNPDFTKSIALQYLDFNDPDLGPGLWVFVYVLSL